MDGYQQWIVSVDTRVVHQFIANGGKDQRHGCHSLLAVDDHGSLLLLLLRNGSARQSSEGMAQGGSFPCIVPERLPLIGGPAVPPLENRNLVGILGRQDLPQGSTPDPLAGSRTNSGLVRGVYLCSKGVGVGFFRNDEGWPRLRHGRIFGSIVTTTVVRW